MSSSAARSANPTNQRERQRAETRERLFQAAVAEFRRAGYEAAQIPAIAEAAGVVRGTFYFHFPSKEHVLREMVERRGADLSARLAALDGARSSLDDVLAGLLDAMEPTEGEEETPPELVREIVAMQLRTPIDPDEEDPIFLALIELFSALAERGEVRRDVPPEPLAATVMTTVFGLAVARGARPREEVLPSREQLLAMLLPGLRPRA